jgi:hypothetical protein
MSIAGHVSRKILEHYSHIRLEAKRAAVNGIATPPPMHQNDNQMDLGENEASPKLLN